MKTKRRPTTEQQIRSAVRLLWHRGEARRTALARTRIKGHAFHVCESCNEVTREPECDHAVEVGKTPIIGGTGWSAWMARMFCEASMLRVLCRDCHELKTAAKRATERRPTKRRQA